MVNAWEGGTFRPIRVSLQLGFSLKISYSLILDRNMVLHHAAYRNFRGMVATWQPRWVSDVVPREAQAVFSVTVHFMYELILLDF